MSHRQKAEDGAAIDPDMGLAERADAVNLFPAERRILTQLLAIDPFTLGSMTSSDLSERSGASRSSIDRLSRKLGYGGLKEMRRSLLEEAKAGGGGLRAADVDASSSIGLAKSVLTNIGDRLEPFAQSLSQPGLLDRLVDWMIGARSIGFFGAGESAAVCSALYLRLMRLGLPVQFSQEHHTQVSVAGMMRAGDVAIIVSYSGRSKSVVWAAQTAKDAGAHIVAVSSAAPSPLSRMSDLHIALPGAEGFDGSPEIHDRILSVALGQILFECIAARRPDLLDSAVHVDDLFGEDRL
ncbi:MurR/RpiR family transcriptional regulator [Pseudoroseicyclus sp. CXY001]|uniref:MurR/RpiR family transcriptional regulator n=1 Tax=Pseudoroseicyclus sp. CXY001 TaxID=3242492 RepID=UPI0035715DD8